MLDISPQQLTADLDQLFHRNRPDRAQAEEAVKTLIRWIGDDPDREGLRDTPSRFLRACDEWFSGYLEEPEEHLKRSFEDVRDYDGPVILRDIPFRSCCEHHMAPISGKVHIAYLPANRVVGLSKLARVVEAVTRRLQIQERITAEIAATVEQVLQPRGVAVVIQAQHACMSSRGIAKEGICTITSKMLGAYSRDPALRMEFISSIRFSQVTDQ